MGECMKIVEHLFQIWLVLQNDRDLYRQVDGTFIPNLSSPSKWQRCVSTSGGQEASGTDPWIFSMSWEEQKDTDVWIIFPLIYITLYFLFSDLFSCWKLGETQRILHWKHTQFTSKTVQLGRFVSYTSYQTIVCHPVLFNVSP